MNNVTSRKRPYNPSTVRRRAIQETVTLDGQALYRAKSFTQPGDKIEWHPSVDMRTGECLCDCPDFRFKKKHAHLNQPATWCKHIERALGDLERKRELPTLKARLEAERADREAEWKMLLDRAEAEPERVGGSPFDLSPTEAAALFAYAELKEAEGACLTKRGDELDAYHRKVYEGVASNPRLMALADEARVENAALEAQARREVPPHVDPETGEIRAGWFPVVTPVLGFVVGQWITPEMVQAARDKYLQGEPSNWDFDLG